MNAGGEVSNNDLLVLKEFVKGLNKEQADNIMYYLPQLIALLEDPMQPYLQEPFLQIG
jgi:hypothetical protein